jgi:hypothetical protein
VISFVVAWLASVLIIWLVGRGDRPRETLAAR